MKKKFTLFSLLVSLILLTTVSCESQTAAVFAQIQDSTGQLFANGTFIIDFVPTPNTPGPFTAGGSNFTKHFAGSLDGTGVLNQTIVRNDFIQPANSQWDFTVCPKASMGCSTVRLTINTASPNISAQLSAATGTINIFASPSFAYGYKNSEVVITPNPGGTYWDVTLGVLKIWDGSAWGSIAPASTTNVVVTNPSATQTITQGSSQLVINATSGNLFVSTSDVLGGGSPIQISQGYTGTSDNVPAIAATSSNTANTGNFYTGTNFTARFNSGGTTGFNGALFLTAKSNNSSTILAHNTSGSGQNLTFFDGNAGSEQINFNIDNGGQVKFGANNYAGGGHPGIYNDGRGLKHIRIGTGSIAASTRVSVTVTWTTGFTDINYTPMCVVDEGGAGATAPSLRLERLNGWTATTVGLTIINDDAGSAHSGFAFCYGMHD